MTRRTSHFSPVRGRAKYALKNISQEPGRPPFYLERPENSWPE